MTINPVEIDKFFKTYNQPTVPGCALAIIHKGEIIYKRGYGYANLENDAPITPNTIFDVGSVSKQFTAMCALLLEEQGKLSLDDDIHKFLPELYYKKPITLRHLIHHTSGIPDYLVLMGLAGMPFYNDYSEAQIIELIARQPLSFSPGKIHTYSNSGYFLLAEIIARVADQSLNDFATEHIFHPLAMKDTQFYDDHTRVIKNRAIGYTPINDGFAIEHYKMDVVGDGAVHTSVEDLFLWDQNFYQATLGSGQALIDKMLTPGKLNSGKSTAYGFGLCVTSYRGQKLIFHNGGWAGYLSEFARFPEQQFSIIVLANRSDHDMRKVWQISHLLLGDILEPDKLTSLSQPKESEEDEAFKIDTEQLESYAGHYVCKSLQTIYTFTVEKENLVFKLPYAKAGFKLKPTASDNFYHEQGLELKFLRNKRGIKGFELKTQSDLKIRFKKVF